MRRKTLTTTALGLVAAQLALPACSTMSDGEKKTWGTIGGALVGAAAGAAIGGKKNRTGGMLIGAAAGAAAGYLLASSFGSKATPEQKASPEFKEAETQFQTGLEAQQAGRNDEAIEHYEKAAEKAPDQPETFVNMGYAYLDKGDRDSAEKNFRKALEIDPENAEAKAGLEAMGVA